MRSLFQDVRLITVDLDDTLWPCGPVIHHAEETLYRWLTCEAPGLVEAHDLASMREHRVRLAAAEPGRAHDLTWLRRQHLRLLLEESGYAPTLADEGVRVFRQARNRVTPFEDVVPVLEAWRSRYILVSMTNGNVELDATPLGRIFHHSLDAVSAGAAKPDPAMFRQALDWAGVAPELAMHVGDDPVRDMAPAMSLGMRTLWVNRGRAVWPQDLEPPDREVETLNGLIP